MLEAAQAATRCNPAWRREFLHLTMRRGRQIATVALARKLAVRLYWMWRNGRDYEMSLQFEFARGAARDRLWCEVEHRPSDWVPHSLLNGSSNK